MSTKHSDKNEDPIKKFNDSENELFHEPEFSLKSGIVFAIKEIIRIGNTEIHININ